MPGTIQGTVLSRMNGRPLADVSITIVKGAGPTADIAPVTGDAGTFALDNLPPGQWTLKALATNGTAVEQIVNVVNNQITDTTIII